MNGSKLFTGAGLVLLITAGATGGAFLVEQTLSNEASRALANAGVQASVSFSGRDARITADGEQLDRAVDVLSGIKLIDNISTSDTPSQKATVRPTETTARTTHPTPVPPSQLPTATQSPSATPTPVPPPVITPEPMPQVVIQFAGGSAVVLQGQEQKIAAIAAWLKVNPGVTIEVVGHTDNSRTSAFRTELASKRAKSVVEALVGTGASREQLVIVTKADAEPAAPNSSAEGRAENRRVTFAPRGER